ncbi:MAG: hypothetical protein WCL16_05530 [bacterium]
MALLCVAALLTITAAQASVFQRLGRSGASDEWLRGLPGRLLYSAVVEVNGVVASVAALAMDDADAALLRQHLRQSSEAIGRVTGSSAGDGVARTDSLSGDRRRMLLTFTPPGGAAVLLAVDQPAAEIPAGAPAGAVPVGFPLFPGARPLCYMSNRSSGSTLATAQTTASPAAILAFYEMELSRSGWTAASPGDNRGAAGVLLYRRGRELRCVFAQPDASGSGSRIAVLTRGTE